MREIGITFDRFDLEIMKPNQNQRQVIFLKKAIQNVIMGKSTNLQIESKFQDSKLNLKKLLGNI